jgi:hypothetical protein
MPTRARTRCVRVHEDGWPVDGPRLRLFGGGGEVGPDPADGRPKIIGRCNGYPLELRAWPRRPAGVADAVWHPAGVWVSVRVL